MFALLLYSLSLCITCISMMLVFFLSDPKFLLFTAISLFAVLYFLYRMIFILKPTDASELVTQSVVNGSATGLAPGATRGDLPSGYGSRFSGNGASYASGSPDLAGLNQPTPAPKNTAKMHSPLGSKPNEVVTATRRIVEPSTEVYTSKAPLKLDAETELLFASLCHEIRTPLNGVTGMIELLLDTKITPKQRQITQTVYNSSHVLNQVVNDYVLFFQSQSKSMTQASKSNCHLEEMLLQVSWLFQGLAYDKKLDFVVDIDRHIPETIFCDAHKLQQVVGNLTLNALKYTRRGEIRIGAYVHLGDEINSRFETGNTKNALKTNERFSSTGGPIIEIFVSDTGPGISEDEIQDLFVPFKRVSSSTKTTGAGLGLSICKILAEELEAELVVDSEVGVGTTFSLFMQVTVVEEPSVVPQESEAEFSCDIADVFVYGGEIGSSSALQQYLRELGYHVKEGEEADLDILSAADQVLKGPDFVFVFEDRLGCQAAQYYQSTKTPLCHVRWMSDPKTFDNEDELTLIRPFSRMTIQEILRNTQQQALRLSTVDRWRSTFGERFNLTILVVEDDPTSMTVLTGMLEKLGFDSHQAVDGEQAIKKVRELNPDIVFLDMHLPHHSGIEVISACKNELQPWWIMTSAGSSLLKMEHADQYGFNDILGKPLTVDALRNVIMRATTLGTFCQSSNVLCLNDTGKHGTTHHGPFSEGNHPDSKLQPYEQLKLLYARTPIELATLIRDQIQHTDHSLSLMKKTLAAKDLTPIRDHAHAMRSSAAFAGAYKIAHEAEFLDTQWPVLDVDTISQTVRHMGDLWMGEERDRLLSEVRRLAFKGGNKV